MQGVRNSIQVRQQSNAQCVSILISRSAVFGLVYMLPILFTLGDLETILASVTGQPVPEMFLQATGSRGAAFGLFFIGELVSIRRDDSAITYAQCSSTDWHVVWRALKLRPDVFGRKSLVGCFGSTRHTILTSQVLPRWRSTWSSMAWTCFSPSPNAGQRLFPERGTPSYLDLYLLWLNRCFQCLHLGRGYLSGHQLPGPDRHLLFPGKEGGSAGQVLQSKTRILL